LRGPPSLQIVQQKAGRRFEEPVASGPTGETGASLRETTVTFGLLCETFVTTFDGFVAPRETAAAFTVC